MPGVHGCRTVLRISRPTWIAVWTLAILVTVVGGIPQGESWRFDIQLPGALLALVLMYVARPLASMLGADGEVFLIGVTILTNGIVYASLVALVLVVREVFRS
jgi:hypothetical protein